MESLGSLPVPSVQELATEVSDRLDDIPQRYIRPEVHAHQVSNPNNDIEIPVIDFHKLQDLNTTVDESYKLHVVCQHWGFFQLINHSVSSEVVECLKLNIEEFFKLPIEQKQKFAQKPGKLDGYGQLFVFSQDQKLDWADVLYLTTQPESERKMEFWPTKPLTFRSILDKYSTEVMDATDCLLQFIANNLNVTRDKLKVGLQSMRINYYPPCPKAEQVIGFSPHSDADLLTLVLQVNEIQGLQIKKDGVWVNVKPIYGALIVNVGDQLEIFSNGRYKSIEHRVVVNKEKERLSIATFHSPKIDAIISPLTELIKEEAKYKTIDHETLLKMFFTSKLNGKSFLHQLKIE